MKTNHRFSSPATRAAAGMGRFSALLGAVILATSALVRADVPGTPSGRFAGIYKVTSSTDPIFPATKTREYFLDFGQGMQMNKSSGSVAVSLRQNPRVQVRIMAWQYFPDQGKFLIGNPRAEGSRKAVARAEWSLSAISNGIVFERGDYRVVLQRPDPGDY